MLRQLKLYDQCEMLTESRKTGKAQFWWVETIIAFLLIDAFQIISIFVITFPLLIFGDPNNTTHTTLAQLYCLAIGICLTLWYCKKYQKRSMRSIGFTKNGAAVQYIKGLVIGFGMFGAVILIGVLFGAFKFIELNSEANFIVILLFFFGFMFQGMFEEAVCRGYLMMAASHKKPIVYGIIANSLVFALMHCANPGIGILPIINLILFGIFASLYTLRTDNIWGIGAIHSVWNFVQGNFYGLSVSGTNQMPSIFVFESTGNELIDGGTFGPEGGICVTIVMIVGILLLLIPTKNSKENSDKCISCVQEGSVSR